MLGHKPLASLSDARSDSAGLDVLCRVLPIVHGCEEAARLYPGLIRGEGGCACKGDAPRAPAVSVLDDIGLPPGRHDAEPVAGHLIVPKEVICGARFCGVNYALGDF